MILPSEVLIDILSRLPPKSLIKFQIVCKEWDELINSRYITEKQQRECSDYVHYYYNVHPDMPGNYSYNRDTKLLKFILGCDGLLLMKSILDNKYCIWNPATHLFLELPDPHKDSYVFALSYVQSTNNYKLFSIYYDEQYIDKVWQVERGWQVFILGHSKEWKSLTFSDYVENNDLVVPVGANVHFIQLVGSPSTGYAEVVASLDMGTECFSQTYLPDCLFTEIYDDLWEALDWEGKLGFFDMVGEKLHVMVLEDCKKEKWGEMKIIPLAFMEKESVCKRNLVPLFAKNGDIWFQSFGLGNEKIFTYTIRTGGCTDVMKMDGGIGHLYNFYPYKPSMVGFEGMVPDTKLQRFRPHSLM